MVDLYDEIINWESKIYALDSDFIVSSKDEISKMSLMRQVELLKELKSKYKSLKKESKKTGLIDKINNLGLVTKKELKGAGLHAKIHKFDYYKYNDDKYAVPKGYVNKIKEEVRNEIDEKVRLGEGFSLGDLLISGHPIVIDDLLKNEVETIIKQGMLKRDGARLTPNYVNIGVIGSSICLINKTLINRINKACSTCGSHFIDDTDILVNYKGRGSYGEIIYLMINYLEKIGLKASSYGGGIIVEQ
jgi:hypothetical protein